MDARPSRCTDSCGRKAKERMGSLLCREADLVPADTTASYRGAALAAVHRKGHGGSDQRVAQQVLTADRGLVCGIDGAREKLVGDGSRDCEPGSYARAGKITGG